MLVLHAVNITHHIVAAFKPEFVPPLKDIKSPIDGTITLKTQVKGVPTPTVVWKLNDQPLEESDTIKMVVEKPNVHTLTFLQAPESLNEATVTCFATNVAGEATTKSVLSVTGRAPEFISKPIKCTILEGTCVVVLSTVQCAHTELNFIVILIKCVSKRNLTNVTGYF